MFSSLLCIHHQSTNAVPVSNAGNINIFSFSGRPQISYFFSMILPGIIAILFFFFSILTLPYEVTLGCACLCFHLLYFPSLISLILQHSMHLGNFIRRAVRPHFSSASGISRWLLCILSLHYSSVCQSLSPEII